MKIRHRLIRWLAQGDLIIMNAQFTSWDTVRTKEAGGGFICNCDFYGNGIHETGLKIEQMRNYEISYCLFDKFKHAALYVIR